MAKKEERFEVTFRDGSQLKDEGVRQILVDKETGVNYLCWKSGYGAAITPCGYTDMRKSIDGLCAVVKDQLNMNPSRPNAIYLFCGRRSDRIKVLLHEREGFVLLYKRLDANVGKYRWPRNRNEVKPITWRQFDWLMSGLEIEQPKAIKSIGNA